MADEVLRELRGEIDILTLNRPAARNAIDQVTAKALAAWFDELSVHPDGPPAILTGAGDRAFCAGMDLKELSRGGGDISGYEALRRVLRQSLGRTVIVAVNGAAIGAGLELVLACDLVVAAEHAVFGIPESKRGLIAGMGGLVRLPARVPHIIALEMALTGDPIDASRALTAGLVNRVVPASQVLDAAVVLAGRIAANAPGAVMRSRQVVKHAAVAAEPEVWAVNDEALATTLATDDALRGPQALATGEAASWAPPSTAGT